MSRVFQEFPQNEEFQQECPLCNTHENKPCILIPIEGTQKDHVVECVVAHLDCVLENVWIYPNNSNLIVAMPDDNWERKEILLEEDLDADTGD